MKIFKFVPRRLINSLKNKNPHEINKEILTMRNAIDNQELQDFINKKLSSTNASDNLFIMKEIYDFILKKEEYIKNNYVFRNLLILELRRLSKIPLFKDYEHAAAQLEEKYGRCAFLEEPPEDDFEFAKPISYTAYPDYSGFYVS